MLLWEATGRVVGIELVVEVHGAEHCLPEICAGGLSERAALVGTLCPKFPIGVVARALKVSRAISPDGAQK